MVLVSGQEKGLIMKYAFSMEKIRLVFISSLLCGVVTGTIFMNCLDIDILRNLEIYGSYISEKLYNTKINRLDFFQYIFIYRIKEIAFIVILGLTAYRYMFHSMFLFYLGIKHSMLICMLTIIKKNTAVLWYFAMTQPQTIIYAILIYYIMKKLDFSRDISYKKTRIKDIILCITGVIIMCWIESTLNITFLLKLI